MVDLTNSAEVAEEIGQTLGATITLNPRTIDDFRLLADEGILQGIFPGIDGDQYHRALPGTSKTDIEAAALSPANMIARRALEEDESEALLLGKMFHSRIEHWRNPSRYHDSFIVMPTFSGTGMKAAKAEWLAKHEGRRIFGTDQVDQVESMFRGLWANPQSRALLEAAGEYEETIFWRDQVTGVLCKCRPDKRIPDYLGSHVAVDWKSIGKFSPRECADAIHDHGYYVSAAFTLDGMAAVGLNPDAYVFVFVEKAAPHRVLCVTAQEIDIDLGRRKYRKILAQIAECQKTNVWPGFVDIGMSDWARKKLMEELA